MPRLCPRLVGRATALGPGPLPRAHKGFGSFRLYLAVLRLAALRLAALCLGGFLDRRVVLLDHLLVAVDLLREAPSLEALGRELFLRRNRGEINPLIVGSQLLERYDRLVRAHGLVLGLLGGDSNLGLALTVLRAVTTYPIQNVQQGFFLRPIGEVSAARIEILHRARPIEGHDRR